MKVVLHGKLVDLIGRDTYEMATDVPAEAIEGLSRQLPGWPRDMLIDAVGFNTDEKLRTKTDETELHLVPSLCGGGGVGKIILGAALIAVAVFVPGLGTIAGIAVSGVLFSVGLSLVLSGIMQLFMKAPTIDKSQDPPPSKYLGNNANTVAAGTYRILAWGRNRIAGHWLSIQVDAKTIIKGRFPVTAP